MKIESAIIYKNQTPNLRMEDKSKDASERIEETENGTKQDKSKIESSEEASSPLVESAQETLKNLRRVSQAAKLMKSDDTNLEDDEADLKTPPPALEEKESPRMAPTFRRTSKLGSILLDDMKALSRTNLKVEEQESLEESSSNNQLKSQSEGKYKRKYDKEQASLIGAVLGIGERNWNADAHRPVTSSAADQSTRIGTMAGLGDVTDEDAVLIENDTISDSKTEEYEDVPLNDSNNLKTTSAELTSSKESVEDDKDDLSKTSNDIKDSMQNEQRQKKSKSNFFQRICRKLFCGLKKS